MSEKKLFKDEELNTVHGAEGENNQGTTEEKPTVGGFSVGKNDQCHFAESKHNRVRGCMETCGTCYHNNNRSALTGYCDYPNTFS